MPIQTLNNPRLYQQAAEQIALLIQSGEYPVGAKLPAERDLARQLGVSRPTVREALIALEIQGHVEVRIGSGTVVKNAQAGRSGPGRASLDVGPSPFEVLSARRMIEPPIAAMAAVTITRAELSALNETLDLLKGDPRNHAVNLEADRAFHTLIAEATHNAIVIEMIARLWEGMFGGIFAALTQRTTVGQDQQMTYTDHSEIVRCIERRDAPGAAAMMTAHLIHAEMKLLHNGDRSDPILG
jgi:DNA-binding FadR family transcriptional regulator